MNRKRSLLIALPVLVILAALAFYEYVYLGIQAEVASVKEAQTAKANSLQKYLTFVRRSRTSRSRSCGCGRKGKLLSPSCFPEIPCPWLRLHCRVRSRV